MGCKELKKYLYFYSNMNISVAIVEDDADIRQLMQLIIDGSPGFMCDKVYNDCETAVPELIASPPDIILMDIDLPGMNGVEGVKMIRQQNMVSSILMLTIHEGSNKVFDSLCAGANGYLIKGIPPVELLAALKDAHEGGAPMSSSIASKVVKYFHTANHTNLSERELEILQLLCDGENYSTIASALFISKNTVKGHIKNIYKKLEVNNRAEAVLKAHKTRLIR